MSQIFELFGYRLDAWSAIAAANRAQAHCPFMGERCDGGGNRQQSAITLGTYPKLAKYFPGIPKVQAGVCSLSIKANEQPWIVCPRRLLAMNGQNSGHQEYVKEVLAKHSGLPGGAYRVWKEVKMKVSTTTELEEEKSFDYTFDYIIAGSCKKEVKDVAALMGVTPKKAEGMALESGFSLAQKDGVKWVESFPSGPILIVEVMTSSTSGGNKKNRTQIAMAFEDAVRGLAHKGPGINYRQVWARMVSQLIVKSQVALSWGGKTTWVIQDVLADYISASTALDLSKYLAEKPGEVNILSFGYGDLTPNESIVPMTNAKFYSGPISKGGAGTGFVDIVKIGAAPPVTHLWRALFTKGPVSSFKVSA